MSFNFLGSPETRAVSCEFEAAWASAGSTATWAMCPNPTTAYRICVNRGALVFLLVVISVPVLSNDRRPCKGGLALHAKSDLMPCRSVFPFPSEIGHFQGLEMIIHEMELSLAECSVLIQ